MQASGLSAAEAAFINDLTKFGGRVFDWSSRLELLTGTPSAVSTMLYHRLWSNYRGYLLLWKQSHLLEAGIVLRACIESAICVCANAHLRERFYPLLLGDLAATLKNMVKVWRGMGADDLVRSFETTLRTYPDGTPERPKAFNWEELAEHGEVPYLYQDHKFLSATTAHVTALSLLRGVSVAGEDHGKKHTELFDLDRTLGPMMACVALFTGLKHHLATIGADELQAEASELQDRLDTLSKTPI